MLGFLTIVSTAAWLWKPAWFLWATLRTPTALRWLGVAGFAFTLAWLLWMFHTLGRNLTGTVVTRRNAISSIMVLIDSSGTRCTPAF